MLTQITDLFRKGAETSPAELFTMAEQSVPCLYMDAPIVFQVVDDR
jgi:hypothetical protein